MHVPVTPRARQVLRTGRVELVAKLGRGVWLADHAQHGRVVYKRAAPLEVEIARRAATVRIFEHDRDHLVMAVVPGERLDALIRRRGHLSVRDAIAIARELARSLATLHAIGIVHRDVKPENVVGTTLIDFGSARMRDELGPRTSGTPAYMAPEREPGVPGDIYSLGCVLFAMLAGRPPFVGSRRALIAQHRTRPAPWLSRLVGGVSRELEDLVARCLAKDPAARFSSAAELGEALGRIDDHQVCPRLAPRLPNAATTLSASAIAIETRAERAASPALVACALAAASALALITGARIAERAGQPTLMPAARPVAVGSCHR